MTPISNSDWPRGWREHQQQQLERWAILPFAQKLQWLEEAHRMTIELQKTRPSINSKGEYFPAMGEASTRE